MPYITLAARAAPHGHDSASADRCMCTLSHGPAGSCFSQTWYTRAAGQQSVPVPNRR